MKKVFRLMMMAMMAVATMGFVACEKDNDNNNGGQQGGGTTPVEEPTYETLERTEWEGVYSTYDQTPGYTQNYLNIHWTIDFLSNGEGNV